MKPLTRNLTLLVPLALLSACEAVVSRHLVVSAAAVPNPREVETVFDSFAIKHAFTCHTERTAPLLKECRALGPRFLRIERKDSVFVIHLDQPFPGMQRQAPKRYSETAEELEQIFKTRFGSGVEVISKSSPNNMLNRTRETTARAG